MSEGTAHGGTCFATQAEAAARFCSSVSGATASGHVSCDGSGTGATLSGTVGGSISYPWVMRIEPATGTATIRDATTQLHSCERFDLAYHSPWIGAWVLAMAAVLGVKLTVHRIFGSDPT